MVEEPAAMWTQERVVKVQEKYEVGTGEKCFDTKICWGRHEAKWTNNEKTEYFLL